MFVCVCVCVLNKGVSSFILYVCYISVCLRVSATIACSTVHNLDNFVLLPLIHLASLSTTFVSFMCLCLIFVSYKVVIHIFAGSSVFYINHFYKFQLSFQ